MANIIWWPILDNLTVLNQPFFSKNIGNAQQTIQTFRNDKLHKTEKDFNLKGNIYDFYQGTAHRQR